MAKAKKVPVQQPTMKQSAVKQPAIKPSTKKSKTKQPVVKPEANKQLSIKQPTIKQPTIKPATKPMTKRLATKQTTRALGQASTFNALQYMTVQELTEIDCQFARALAGIDVVLFWTGVDFNHVQRRAFAWRLKTLTMAMGPLMDAQNSDSPKARKGKASYSRYVKGASGRFAQYACDHCRRVVVITNPPPDRYSSRDNNTYQSLEEPILKGLYNNKPIARIDYVHPTVDGAAHITYQVWPQDSTQVWTGEYHGRAVKSWKKLNNSYKSLIGMSRLDLLFSRKQKRTISPIQSSRDVLPYMHDPKPQPASCGSETRPASRAIESGYTVQDRLCEKDIARPVPTRNEMCIEEPGSCLVDNRPEPVNVCISSSRPEWQDHNQNGRNSDIHGVGVLDKPSRSQSHLYEISQCRMPSRPVIAPIVSINELTVGTEITVNVNESDSRGVFLYLSMDTTRGLRYWKLGWKE